MSNLSFFRQLGWVLVATVASGACNSAVHLYARLLGPSEYGLLQAFLQSAVPQLSIPALGLQVAFVHLMASVVTPAGERDVAAAVRRVCLVLVSLWTAAAVLVAMNADALVATYKLRSTAELTVLMLTVLVSILQPVFSGIVQGRQDFLWFGWIMILTGAGRFVGVGLMIILFGATAMSAMIGILFGASLALGMAAWRSRMVWMLPAGEFQLAAFLKQVTPLTLAQGAMVFLQSRDGTDAKAALSPEAYGLYSAAGGIGRAVLYLSAPMINVMFPRIVREAAQSTRSGVLMQACGASLLVCGGAALAATLFPELPFRIVQGAKFVDAAPLLPLFSWSLLPLMLANVLVNNLLARARYAVVLPLVGIAVGYGFALQHFNASAREIILTLGTAASAALAVTLAFTWWEGRRSAR